MLAESLGQVEPGCTGSGDTEHGVDEQAIILGGTSGIALFTREQELDTLPIFIRDF